MTPTLPTIYLAFGIPSGMEFVVVLLIVLLLFGSRLPGIARNLGRSLVEFKRGIKGEDEDEDAPGALPKGDDAPESLPKGEAARKNEEPASVTKEGRDA